MGVPDFREEGNKIELKQKRRPGSLGLEEKFPPFVSEISQHPLYTYIAKVGNKIEKTAVSNNFRTHKFIEEKPLGDARLPATKGLILLDTGLLACSSPRPEGQILPPSILSPYTLQLE